MKTKWIPITAASLFLGCMTATATDQSDRLWFPTGKPAIVEFDLSPTPLLTEGKYREFTEKLKGWESLVRLQELSDDQRPLVGYGANFSIGGKNVAMVVRGSDEDAYVMRADINGNGTLADEDPIAFKPDGKAYTATLETMATGVADGETVEYPVKIRFVFERLRDDEEVSLGYRAHFRTVRRGTIHVDGEQYPFALYGFSGIYDGSAHIVWFDLNQDGAGFDKRKSPEHFQVADKKVRLGDHGFRFEVDRFGRSLALTPLDGSVAERPSIDPGSDAPDFQAVSLDGQHRNRDGYHGRVLLLDFWAAWCGPCVEEAPKLAELYEQHGDDGLAIFGVTPDREQNIKDFTERFDHAWPQIAESLEGNLHRTYRAFGYPTKYVIDRDGTILCGRTGPGFWEECWPKAEERLSP